jgi:hypothetical protein
MLGSLFVLFALAAAVFVGLLSVAGLLVYIVLTIVLLPFRLLGWVLWIPFLVVKTTLAAAVGLVMIVPFVLATLAFAALVVVGILVGVVVLPLVPLLAVAAFVWLLLKASASPATL